jgi:glycosyltransferase involved in cell wall biosynthesis
VSLLPAGAAKVLELLFVFASTLQARITNRADVLITIVQGRYYLAAALVAWVTRMPHITIVHDNFLSDSIGPSGPIRSLKRYLTRQTLKKADHLYAVSPEMQRLVSAECGRNPELQLPSSTTPLRQAGRFMDQKKREGKFIVLFAGLIGYTVKDCLDLLVELIKSGELERGGISGVQLHLYTAMSEEDLQTFGWDHADVIYKGWVTQSELSGALAEADVLFLPYSFLEGSRAAVETAFPSKTADYLAAGKPLLVFGPPYSSLVRYASEYGFAEIVDEFSLTALAQGIRNIACSPDYRAGLAVKAFNVFRSNHDIETQRRNFYLTLSQI